MRLYGYKKKQSDEAPELLELKEVTLCSSPEKLRALSQFLSQCADDMEENENWEHEHFNGCESPDFIIYNEKLLTSD